MTQRLPVPGGDNGTWGDILNGFLEVSLNADGTIQTAALSQAGGEVTSNKGIASGYASLNSSGLVPTTQLATGTASSSNYLRGDGTWVAAPGAAQSLVRSAVITAAGPTTLTAQQLTPVDTTSNAVALKLPQAPADQTTVAIKVINGTVSGGMLANTCTYTAQGSDVINKAGGSTSGTLSLLNQGVVLAYQASSSIWTITGDDLPLSQLEGLFYTDQAVFPVNFYGADPTGTNFSDTAFAAAQAAANAAGSEWVLTLGVGTYKIANTYSFTGSQGLIGSGSSLTEIEYTGSGDCLRIHNPTYTGALNAGPFSGFTVDGSSAGAGAAGIHVGDLNAFHPHDITVQHFNGTGSINWHFDNLVQQCEKIRMTACRTYDGTQGLVFDNHISGAPTTQTSFDYGHFEMDFNVNANQSGFVVINGASLVSPTFNFTGNFIAADNLPNTGIAIQIGNSSSDPASIAFWGGTIQFETDTSGESPWTGHTSIYMYADTNFQGGGILSLIVGVTNANWQAPTISNGFAFFGVLNVADATSAFGTLAENAIFTTYGGINQIPGFFGSSGQVYLNGGNAFTRQFTVGSYTLAFENPSTGRAATFLVGIQQPASGGNATFSWPGSITWAGGVTPVLSTVPSFTDWFRFNTLNQTSFAGEWLTAPTAPPSSPPCDLVATSNITLSGSQTVDGTSTIQLRILATAQSTASNNGPWLANTSGAWTRPTDYVTGASVYGRIIQVVSGTIYAATQWQLDASTSSPIVVGTTSTTWTIVTVPPYILPAARAGIPNTTNPYLVTANGGSTSTTTWASSGNNVPGYVYFVPVDVIATTTFTGLATGLYGSLANIGSVLLALYNDNGQGWQPLVNSNPVSGTICPPINATLNTGTMDAPFGSTYTAVSAVATNTPTSGEATLTVTNITGFSNGQTVLGGAGLLLPVGTTVVSASGTSIVISANPTSGTTGMVVVSVPVTLPAGRYWIGLAYVDGGSTPSTYPTFVTLAMFGNTVLSGLTNSSFKGWAYGGSASATALPVSEGWSSISLGGGGWPIAGLKVAT